MAGACAIKVSVSGLYWGFALDGVDSTKGWFHCTNVKVQVRLEEQCKVFEGRTVAK